MIRVACTALLKRIKAGRPNKAGNSFIGGGDDVTSDCIKAIIEFVGVGGIHEVTVNGKPMYEIEVRYPQPVEQTERALTDEARDAARYRWLRRQHWNEADMFVVAGSKSQVRLGTDCPSLVRLDDAIDAALTAAQPASGDQKQAQEGLGKPR
ncbi:hypothetical protein [Paraburkholderia domus]|uniref:DUF7446 family protein n=1 Tax=Paraburkholderia domus TaxID=2793075 RepID=UPI001913D256|nr:hypothetical protein [Paraburkholderia domus]MBK5061746.1 hypothetical protein [Burkholderia sp. R-70199]CAE6899696.1 hypothetical protein R70199_03619 [Paraburkholderia domus]